MQVKRGLGPIPCNSTSPQTGANPRALTGHRGNTLRLLDRSKELHILNEAFTESTRSSGRFVIVTGGPGSGKTQLLHEFLAAPGRSGARILQGTAHPAERDRPMSLLRQLLRNGEVLPVQADPARPAGRQTEPLPRNAERRADMEFGDPDTATTETLLRLADGERPWWWPSTTPTSWTRPHSAPSCTCSAGAASGPSSWCAPHQAIRAPDTPPPTPN